MLGVYVYHRDRGDSTMNDNKSRRVGNIFSGIAGCLSVLPGKRTDGYLWERTGIFLYEDPVVQFHGADLQSAGPEAAEISAGRDFCVPSGKFSGVSEEPLSGQWTERRYLRIATPALCGICGGTIGRCRPGGLPG